MKMKFIFSNKKFMIFFLLFLFLFSCFFVNRFWYSPISKSNNYNFVIYPGNTIDNLIQDFDSKNIFAPKVLIRFALAFFKPDFILKAGEYTLAADTSFNDFFKLIQKGISTQYKFLFVEGMTLNQTIESLKKESKLKPFQHKLISNNISLDKKAIELMDGLDSYEGWFLPDTYFYESGDSWASILERSHIAMMDFLNDEWENRQNDLPYKNLYEALIMASIIEKETGLASERKKISGVFVKRLKIGMRLQTDPTVIYGMGEDFKGNLRRKDLLRDGMYNTYTRKGLPPTPISLPGKESIHAALNPQIGDELYFVAKGDGGHYFSKTLEEHELAVKRFQILKRTEKYKSYLEN